MAAKPSSSYDPSQSLINIINAVKRGMLYRGHLNKSTALNNPAKAANDDKKTKKTKDKLNEPTELNENQDDSEKLEIVARKAHEILFKVETVFPFTLFPDTITVEREKINIAKRFFFRVAKIIHIPVRDLLSVEADVGPFFGSVHITSRFFNSEPFTVTFLWRQDAINLQRLLQGYIISHERDIDATNIEKDKLVKLLNELGGGEDS